MNISIEGVRVEPSSSSTMDFNVIENFENSGIIYSELHCHTFKLRPSVSNW